MLGCGFQGSYQGMFVVAIQSYEVAHIPPKEKEGEVDSPLQASGLGSKLRTATGNPFGSSGVSSLPSGARRVPSGY